MARFSYYADRAASPKPAIIAGLVLIVLIAVAYGPSFNADFVNVDDGAYVYDNEIVKAGMSWEGVTWVWTANLAGNWQPLTLLSHMLDVELFGLDARGHHVVNVLFHALNTVLVMIVLLRMTGLFWPSVIAAALFAVHPLRVESVAWISERKDVLSTFFGLLAIWAYVRYAAAPNVRRYVPIVIMLTLSLMSKAMFVTLPFLLLLLDVWPLRRWRMNWLGAVPAVQHEGANTSFPARSLPKLLLEKIPLFALVVGVSGLAWLTQRTIGATEVTEFTLGQRVGNAVVAYWRYVEKTFWPRNLVFFYDHPGDWPLATIALAGGALVMISVLALALFRSRPFVLIGWLWFLGTLVPVIGLVQIGKQSMADRYMYFPQLGLIVAAVWLTWSLRRIKSDVVNLAKPYLWLLSMWCVIIGIFTVQTRSQTRVWANTDALFGHALKVNPDDVLVLNLMGQHLYQTGRQDQAMAYWLRAARLSPNQVNKELEAFERELKINPDKPENMNNVAWYLATHPDPAKRNGVRALALSQRANEMTDFMDPAHLDTLAAAYAEMGDFTQAVRFGRRARNRAIATGQPQLAPGMDERLRHYQMNLPFRLPEIK